MVVGSGSGSSLWLLALAPREDSLRGGIIPHLGWMAEITAEYFCEVSKTFFDFRSDIKIGVRVAARKRRSCLSLAKLISPQPRAFRIVLSMASDGSRSAEAAMTLAPALEGVGASCHERWARPGKGSQEKRRRPRLGVSRLVTHTTGAPRERPKKRRIIHRIINRIIFS